MQPKLSCTIFAVISTLVTHSAWAAGISAMCLGGTVDVLDSGAITYTKDGSTQTVYNGNSKVAAMSSCGTEAHGVVVFFKNQSPKPFTGAYYSPDCRDVAALETGSKTQYVYDPSLPDTGGVVDYVRPYKTGVATKFANGGQGTYYSPDCLFVGGGGHTSDKPF
jgi:hypothetical protein